MNENIFDRDYSRLGLTFLGAVFTAFWLSFSAVSADAATDDETFESPEPVLISAVNSTRALAANADSWRGVLPQKNSEVFLPGGRVVIFVTNVNLLSGESANAFRVYAENASGRQYRLTVENIQQLRKPDWIYALTVRIYDTSGFNGQPPANGDVLIRVSWRGNTSNRVRLGLGTSGGKIKDDADAVPTPAPNARRVLARRFTTTAGDRARFIEQAAFGPTPALDLRLRQLGLNRWIEEQFAVSYPTFPYPNQALVPIFVTPNCPTNSPCNRDHYTQYLNQNWLFKEALYGEDQLRRRISWALHQIWVTSGIDIQQQRWTQEYIEILDRNAFGNYRNLMQEMTLNPAMGHYLDMMISTRQNPNENYPREILQLFTIGLDMLNQDGTPILDQNGNPIPTYEQDKIDQFTKVFTGWTLCNNGADPACPNYASGAPNYIDPMYIANSDNHDQTAKILFNYPGAPNPTIPACTSCTNDANRIAYAKDSLNKTLDNIFHHPNVGPFIGKLLIQQLVTSDPSPAYVARAAAAFNNNGSNVRGDMKAVIKAILLDPEARGSRKTDPNYGKLREPFQLFTNLLRSFDVKSEDGTQQSDGCINDPYIIGMGQDLWKPQTVFSYYPPDYIVPGTDLLGPEFGITNAGTSFARIGILRNIIYGRIGTGFNTPLGTSISLAEPTAWATADPSGDLLLDNLNARMLHGSMSPAMRDTIRTAISVAGMTATQKAQQAMYLVATSSQYQVQR